MQALSESCEGLADLALEKTVALGCAAVACLNVIL